VIAGSWLIASVCIDRTRQSLSMIRPVCGRSSLISVPDSPHGLKPYFDAITGKLFWPLVIPVSRWPLRIESGSSLPCRATSPGFGSSSSICEGPPDWKR
jgi:hypothetical protein